jgi:hypothetical protein
MVKISDRDCLFDNTWADGALGSATGWADNGEVFLRPSSSSGFLFILTVSIRNSGQDAVVSWLDEDGPLLWKISTGRWLDIYACACWCTYDTGAS